MNNKYISENITRQDGKNLGQIALSFLLYGYILTSHSIVRIAVIC